MSLLQDLSYSFNSLRKSPGFSLVVIITLALGIGANSAVFSMIDVLLLHPLPYPDSRHLLRLSETKTANDIAALSDVSPANFLDWHEQSRAFDSMGASASFRYNLTGRGTPEQVWGGAVSAEWFRTLGVHPELGRDFHEEEDRSSAAPAVLLSDQLWRRKYQADSGIVGKAIGINSESFTVIGVMPAKADFRGGLQLWIPLRKQIQPDRMLWRDSRFLEVIARIKRGITEAQAAGDLNRIAGDIRLERPGGDIYGAAAILPLQSSLNGDLRGMLMVSFATVGLVLLVACANVTNLMLLRVTARTRELAIRMALGARPGDLVRQVVVEGVCLGTAAGLIGLATGIAGKKLLLWRLSWQPSEVNAINLSWPVSLFTFGVSVIAGVVFALIPAMTVVRAEMNDPLRRASSTTTADVKGRRLRQSFVVAEIACSMVLLAGAGLLIRSFQALRHVPLGFDADHRVAVLLSLPRTRYQHDADVVLFYRQVVDKVRSLPGVIDATFTYMLPLSEGGDFSVGFQTVENSVSDVFNSATLRLADSHTMTALSIPMLRGRFIADSDDGGSEPVCVVSRAMAQKYWPNQDPIGHLLVLTRDDINGEKKERRVVGVAGDVRNRINEAPPPVLYVPYAQISFFNMQLLVHTRDSAAVVRNSVETVLQSVDPDQPIRAVTTFSDSLINALDDWHAAITLLGGLAGLAVLLTTLGVFAVISYMVRERTKEIGIRMAVGATRRNISNLVLLQTAWLTLIGAVAGAFLAGIGARLLGGLLYGVNPTDPLTLAISAGLLALLVWLASYSPTRRAARIDPIIALRTE